MSGKSLKLNATLNGIKTMMSILFPLITFPYATRVLQVENLGKINFSNSIISYFMLFAALGISNYAIREGSRYRNDSKKFNTFANQIFTINIISTIISYLSLFFIILLVPGLKEYKLLLLIQSSTIIFTTVGVDWIFSIYEDYLYITIRSLVFQFVSMLLLFILVKDKNNYYLYAFITVISSVGSNTLNYIYSKKYFKMKLTKKLNLKKHLKPILIIFSTSIASTIYVNSDLTLLGIMVGNHAVGIYSVSSKVYSIIKTILSAIIVVSLPRLSYYISKNEEINYKNTVIKIFNSLILITLPAIVGINILGNQIIMIISGNTYIEASTSLRILSIALLFSIFAYFTTTLILLPMKKEKYILLATMLGAIVNVLLNLLLIPLLNQNGAAVTTVIAELIVLSISFFYARKYFKFSGIIENITSSIIGCIAIVFVSLILNILIKNMIMYTVLTIICSTSVYILVLIMVKNKLVLDLINGIKSKLNI